MRRSRRAPSARSWRSRSCRGSRAFATARGCSVCHRVGGRASSRSPSGPRAVPSEVLRRQGSLAHRHRRGRRHDDGRALRSRRRGWRRVSAFVMFRLFDVLKPFPAGADRPRRARRLRRRRRRPRRGRVCRRRHAGASGGPVIKRAAILSTGDELTTGRIADTNAQWIADKLFELGIDVVAVRDRRRLSRAARVGVAAGAVAGRRRHLDGRHRSDGRRPHDRDGRRGARPAARRGHAVGRPHPQVLRVARRRHAAQQPEAGADARGLRHRPESARHRAGLPRPVRAASTSSCCPACRAR